MEQNINTKLDNTINDVQQRLDATTTDLNSAVADAKSAINEQVEQVASLFFRRHLIETAIGSARHGRVYISYERSINGRK